LKKGSKDFYDVIKVTWLVSRMMFIWWQQYYAMMKHNSARIVFL